MHRGSKKSFTEHGWPDHELVGADGTLAALFIAQHAIGEPDFQRASAFPNRLIPIGRAYRNAARRNVADCHSGTVNSRRTIERYWLPRGRVFLHRNVPE
jgi:hypothetical protein